MTGRIPESNVKMVERKSGATSPVPIWRTASGNERHLEGGRDDRLDEMGC